MLLMGVRYCDCCGTKLNRNNNKCRCELCDRCNDRLEAEIKQNNVNAIDFLNFLYQVIPANEMEKYREMYNCKNDKNNC